MNMNSKSGSGCASAFFVILFLASIALNVAFLTGCVTLDKFRRGPDAPLPPRPPQPTHSSSEATYLREIAVSLGLSPSLDKTPGDIAFDIKQALGDSQKYKGNVFSDEEFDKYRKAFLTNNDVKTFEDYHTFAKKVAGKRIVILGN